jgi:hypothetical protein
MRLASALVLVLLACSTAPPPQSTSATSPPAPTAVAPAATTPAPAAAPARPSGPPGMPDNPHQAENDQIAQAVLTRIAGHENDPAETVFKNIQSLKGMPAGRLVRVMNMGYSRALGVACTHCHFAQDYSSDEQRPKRAAREMMAMNKMINEQLRTLKNLEGKPEEIFVSCSTCHRGRVNPNEESH